MLRDSTWMRPSSSLCAALALAMGALAPAGCAHRVNVCGDGILALGEVCDDGDNLSGDGCNADCSSDETCGNGTLDVAAGEGCDDGNTVDGDGCSAVCTLTSCGNGSLDFGEVCDDGNNIDGDGCSATCVSDESCGNGITDMAAGEACDDGNNLDGDGCSAICLLGNCGDGLLDAGEVCDDSNNLDGDGCSGTCTSDESCGNGIVDMAVGEVCDDGNTMGGDGCNGSCTSLEACGDGVVDATAGEQCDDGNNIDGDGCQADCLLPACGDGVLDAGEVCDDGNNMPGDGCNASCTSNEMCGNGIIDATVGEQCDDGNTVNADGCQATCLLPVCGDMVVDPGEQCDDGNTTSGDGCQAGCLLPACGDSVVDAGEQCDDGNTASGDGCSATCQTEMMATGECAGLGNSVLANPGFESGSLAPWVSNGAAVVQTFAFDGTWAAEVVGNFNFEQTFPAVPVSSLTAARFRTWHECSAPMSIEWTYSDATTGSTFQSSLGPTWALVDILSSMDTSKSLISLKIWGFSGGACDPDTTRLDFVELCAP